MTDEIKTEDIIKNLRQCSSGKGFMNCLDCTLEGSVHSCDDEKSCEDELMRLAADRLGQKEAQIADLKSRMKYMFEHSTVRREECNGREVYIGTYHHFKGNNYLIIGTALHTETNETMVLYKEYLGGQRIFARPLEMLLSEVDREKYPDASQKYRFERKDSRNE